MKRQLQHLLLIPVLVALSACTTTGERSISPSCVIGVTGTSAIAGGFAAAATGVGAGAGLVASAFICGDDDTPDPEPAEAAAIVVPVDADGDGVEDDADRCPNTPSGVSVDERGCALDVDNDSVPDYGDECANTPADVAVDQRGCPVKDEIVFSSDTVNFEFDSAALDRESRQTLNAIFEAVKSHSGKVKLAVVGHTDSTGPAAYNLKLSQRRAQAVVDYLVSRGIDRDTLVAVGKGESAPIASNDDDTGRARNRRVELVVR